MIKSITFKEYKGEFYSNLKEVYKHEFNEIMFIAPKSKLILDAILKSNWEYHSKFLEILKELEIE